MNGKKIALAKALAAFAHDGQVDKAGNDYIEHPMHIAAQFEDEEHIIVGLLHDILEDTFVTKETIENLFGEEIAEAVAAMTHGEDEAYLDYVKRAAANPIAHDVKRVDVLHNMDLSRLPEVTQWDIDRVEKKYKPAMTILDNKMQG